MSAQVLSETANVMWRELGFDIPSIRVVINRISQECKSIEPISLATLNRASSLDETQCNRGRLSAVKPRFRFPERLDASITSKRK